MAKKYSARRQKVKTAWLKNALKSVGTTSLSTFKELSPNTYEMASSLGQGIGNIAYAVSSGSSRAGDAAGAIANNKYVKFAKTAYKNAMSDIPLELNESCKLFINVPITPIATIITIANNIHPNICSIILYVIPPLLFIYILYHFFRILSN